MKIVGEKGELNKAIGVVQNIVGTKNTLPILSNILMETGKDTLKFTATDLEIGITTTIPTEVMEDGAATIPAKKLFEIIKELPDGEVAITAKKNNVVTIECKNSFFKIPGLPKEEFPKLPNLQNKTTTTLEQKTLKEMLTKTAFAISRDEARYILNGALFVVGQNKIAIVASDGRRLAFIERAAGNASHQSKKAILPAKAVGELLRALKDDGEIKLSLGDNHALFEANGFSIISRLIEGEFPNYEQAMPKESKEKFSADREALLQATRRVGILASADSQAVKFELSKGKLIISKRSPDAGEAKEELAVEYNGEELSIGFNPNYIVDVLKGLSEEKVGMELAGPEKPGVVRTQDGYIYVVLPMVLE